MFVSGQRFFGQKDSMRISVLPKASGQAHLVFEYEYCNFIGTPLVNRKAIRVVIRPATDK